MLAHAASLLGVVAFSLGALASLFMDSGRTVECQMYYWPDLADPDTVAYPYFCAGLCPGEAGCEIRATPSGGKGH